MELLGPQLPAGVKDAVHDRPVGQHRNDPQDRIHPVKGTDDEEDDPLGTFQEADLAGWDQEIPLWLERSW